MTAETLIFRSPEIVSFGRPRLTLVWDQLHPNNPSVVVALTCYGREASLLQVSSASGLCILFKLLNTEVNDFDRVSKPKSDVKLCAC